MPSNRPPEGRTDTYRERQDSGRQDMRGSLLDDRDADERDGRQEARQEQPRPRRNRQGTGRHDVRRNSGRMDEPQPKSQTGNRTYDTGSRTYDADGRTGNHARPVAAEGRRQRERWPIGAKVCLVAILVAALVAGGFLAWKLLGLTWPRSQAEPVTELPVSLDMGDARDASDYAGLVANPAVTDLDRQVLPTLRGPMVSSYIASKGIDPSHHVDQTYEDAKSDAYLAAFGTNRYVWKNGPDDFILRRYGSEEKLASDLDERLLAYIRTALPDFGTPDGTQPVEQGMREAEIDAYDPFEFRDRPDLSSGQVVLDPSEYAALAAQANRRFDELCASVAQAQEWASVTSPWDVEGTDGCISPKEWIRVAEVCLSEVERQTGSRGGTVIEMDYPVPADFAAYRQWVLDYVPVSDEIRARYADGGDGENGTGDGSGASAGDDRKIAETGGDGTVKSADVAPAGSVEEDVYDNPWGDATPYDMGIGDASADSPAGALTDGASGDGDDGTEGTDAAPAKGSPEREALEAIAPRTSLDGVNAAAYAEMVPSVTCRILCTGSDGTRAATYSVEYRRWGDGKATVRRESLGDAEMSRWDAVLSAASAIPELQGHEMAYDGTALYVFETEDEASGDRPVLRDRDTFLSVTNRLRDAVRGANEASVEKRAAAGEGEQGSEAEADADGDEAPAEEGEGQAKEAASPNAEGTGADLGIALASAIDGVGDKVSDAGAGDAGEGDGSGEEEYVSAYEPADEEISADGDEIMGETFQGAGASDNGNADKDAASDGDANGEAGDEGAAEGDEEAYEEDDEDVEWEQVGDVETVGMTVTATPAGAYGNVALVLVSPTDSVRLVRRPCDGGAYPSAAIVEDVPKDRLQGRLRANAGDTEVLLTGKVAMSAVATADADATTIAHSDAVPEFSADRMSVAEALGLQGNRDATQALVGFGLESPLADGPHDGQASTLSPRSDARIDAVGYAESGGRSLYGSVSKSRAGDLATIRSNVFAEQIWERTGREDVSAMLPMEVGDEVELEGGTKARLSADGSQIVWQREADGQTWAYRLMLMPNTGDGGGDAGAGTGGDDATGIGGGAGADSASVTREELIDVASRTS